MSDAIARLNAARPRELTGVVPDQVAPRKRSASLLIMVVAVTACSSTGGPPASSPGPVSWPPGTYTLEATVVYRYDYEYGEDTLREDYFAVLVIDSDFSLTLQNERGICRDPTRAQVDRDEALRRKTFTCGDITWVVEPGPGSMIRGELVATVTEGIRRRAECRRLVESMNGGVSCVEYYWNVNLRTRRVRGGLTVMLIS